MKPWLLSLDNMTDHLWGGHWIRAFKNLPASGARVGESWELSARPEHPSRVELEGGQAMSLPDLIREQAQIVLGPKIIRAVGERLPLLTKFIDAADDLSVQVHPGDTDLSDGESGKSESWLILDVAPGNGNGFIYLGFDPAKAESYASQDEFIEAFFSALNQANSLGPTDDPAIRARSERVVLPFLNRIRVKPGNVFNVRPGTIHAIGRGVRLFEIQQASDVTYRVWDWNRPDAKERSLGRLAFRTLHIPQARAVLDFRARSADRNTATSNQIGEQELVREPGGLFLLTQINLNMASSRFVFETKGVFQSLTVIQGAVDVNGVKAERGRSILIPASMTDVSVTALEHPARVLRATVPV